MTSYNANNATPSTVSELVRTTKDSKMQEPLVASIDSGPVQAYAKLEGDDFCYYIRTLQVSLGRKVTNPDTVDIPLGNTKSVSRQHARLFYNFSMQRFELTVFGKNGAFVNEQFIERGVTVPLENKMKIQIGEMAFVFLLPKAETNTVNTNNKVSPNNNDDNLNYISTPQQLEKTIASIVATPIIAKTTIQSEVEEICDPSDDDIESEIEDSNQCNSTLKKPPYSYATIIAQAINSTEDKRMTLSGIYNYITTNFPYYQLAQNGWQNSIRHNLSLNKAFVKVPRGVLIRGKGAFWRIDPEAEPQFAKGIYKKTRRYVTSPLSEPAKKRIKKELTIKEISEQVQEEEEEEEEEEEIDEIVSDDEEASTSDGQNKLVDKDTNAINGNNVNTVFCA